MESTIIRRSTSVFLIIFVLSLIPGAADGEVGDIDLISISTEREIFHQNDRVIVDLKLNRSVDPFEIVLISNIDAWVMGIAPLSEQLPYTDLEIQVANELLDNGSYTLEFSLSDQMIWFDGLDMLDNVSITLAFLCMKNQTTDLEVISLKLIDVNEPPSIEGGISVSPEEIKVGEEVSFTISNITDPDMDEITISWEIDNEPAGSKKEIESIFKEPGTHAITVRASDGYMNDSRTRTIDVIAVKETDKDKPEESDDNETAPEPGVEQQEDGNLPWFLIPILLLVIIIVIILGMIRMIITAEDPPEKKEPPRKLWTMTPLRGPSRYEKAVIQGKLRALDNKNVVNMDEERVLEDDIERWELDWNFDPGF